MKRIPTILLLVFVLCSCVGCDQITKDLARERLRFSGPVTLIENAVHLVYAENAGVAFGLGSGLPEGVRTWMFSVGICILLIAIVVAAYIRRHQGKLYLMGTALLVGGGTSNLLDRLMNDGHVFDFMMISLGGLRTAVFNFADVLVLAGAAAVIASVVATRTRHVSPAPHEIAV